MLFLGGVPLEDLGGGFSIGLQVSLLCVPTGISVFEGNDDDLVLVLHKADDGVNIFMAFYHLLVVAFNAGSAPT